MKTLVALLAFAIAATSLAAKPVSISSEQGILDLPADTTAVVVTHVYGKELRALQALPYLESLTVRQWFCSET